MNDWLSYDEVWELYELAYNPAESQVARNNARARLDYGPGIGVLKESRWEQIKRWAGYRCLCCGRYEAEVGPLTIDHIVALSQGGKNVPGNIQPLCAECNYAKGDRSYDYRKGPIGFYTFKTHPA